MPLKPPTIEPGSKCYIARMEVEILFVCKDPSGHESKRRMLEALRDAAMEFDERDIDTHTADYFPGAWDKKCLVYGTHAGDLDAGTAMKLNHDK